MCTPPPANQRRSPSPSPRMIVLAVLIAFSSFRVRCLSSETVDPGQESAYDRFLSFLSAEFGRGRLLIREMNVIAVRVTIARRTRPEEVRWTVFWRSGLYPK